MDFQIHFDERSRSFLIETQGQLTYADDLKMVDAITNHPKWTDKAKLIIDHRESELSHLTNDEIWAIAVMVQRYADKLGEARVAIVVASELEYGLARIWEAYVKKNIKFLPRIFRDKDEAQTWLHATAGIMR